MTTVSIDNLKSIKAGGNKFAAITAYDFSFARQIDKAGIEVTLVAVSYTHLTLPTICSV